jgi:hypothetical protein
MTARTTTVGRGFDLEAIGYRLSAIGSDSR